MRGTRLGRDVVPLVCRMSATSDGFGAVPAPPSPRGGPMKFIPPVESIVMAMCSTSSPAASTASKPSLGPVMMAFAPVSSR